MGARGKVAPAPPPQPGEVGAPPETARAEAALGRAQALLGGKSPADAIAEVKERVDGAATGWGNVPDIVRREGVEVVEVVKDLLGISEAVVSIASSAPWIAPVAMVRAGEAAEPHARQAQPALARSRGARTSLASRRAGALARS